MSVLGSGEASRVDYSTRIRLALCSFCLEATFHGRVQRNAVRRSRWRCETCSRPTLPCRICGKAMARGALLWDDELCALCSCLAVGAPRATPLWASMTPVRDGIMAEALVDGEEFLEAVAEAIEGARRRVFMCFWHMSDKIYLRRAQGRPLREEDRFDRLVQRKAREGVSFYIILWREKNRALWVNNFSEEMERTFSCLHANVHVLRHGHPAPACVPILWSHHQKFVVADDCVALVGGFDVCLGRYDTPKHRLEDGKGLVWPGLDYYNPHFTRPKAIHPFFADSIDRQRLPRMPWHDVSVRVDGEAARDVAAEFVMRWNHHSKGAHRIHVENADCVAPQQPLFHGTCRAQIVRSLAAWSGGPRTDQSQYASFLEAIRGAEHYIYIENQYISFSQAGGGVVNQIGSALISKLREKIRTRSNFRVIVLVPMPEETGDGAMTILNWLYRSLVRGGSSVVEQLRREFPDVALGDYLAFFCLRTHGRVGGRLVTEKIYVHSKTMIVDDRWACISSANLNDRSLLGDRDSEMGVVVTDSDEVDSVMDGKTFRAGRFPLELRLRLWAEHLGLDGSDRIRDPVSAQVYRDLWLATAVENTRVYDRVFPSAPNNTHLTMAGFAAAGGLDMPYRPSCGEAEAEAQLEHVRGHLVLHPVDFLRDEDIRPPLALLIGDDSSQ
jgi:phospholipase D1/2